MAAEPGSQGAAPRPLGSCGLAFPAALSPPRAWPAAGSRSRHLGLCCRPVLCAWGEDGSVDVPPHPPAGTVLRSRGRGSPPQVPTEQGLFLRPRRTDALSLLRPQHRLRPGPDLGLRPLPAGPAPWAPLGTPAHSKRVPGVQPGGPAVRRAVSGSAPPSLGSWRRGFLPISAVPAGVAALVWTRAPAAVSSQLRLAVVEALGPMSHLLPSEKLEEQLPKLLPGVLALYKKHAETVHTSKVRGWGQPGAGRLSGVCGPPCTAGSLGTQGHLASPAPPFPIPPLQLPSDPKGGSVLGGSPQLRVGLIVSPLHPATSRAWPRSSRRR